VFRVNAGNWSFGDYFKKDAINFAYDLLTNVYGLDKKNLYATYFEGDKTLGLPPDLEAKQLWIDVGILEENILPGNAKDNFWEMGDQGPCGPCSELHYDRIGGRNASHLVNQDDPNVIEIWNLVFMQFNREPDRSLRPLPAKHIDTGMGLERVVSILQKKSSNYDTDVFTPIFERIQQVTGVRAYTGKLGQEDVDGIDTAYRVVADHVRTLTFAITDGGVPSNEGRGYVLRRILRRGARFARKKFNVEIGNFFASLVDTVVAEMGQAFPELITGADTVKEILCEEEHSFGKTLDRGERLFGQCLERTRQSGSKVISGADVWKLYDTFGFPVDLTRLMAEENGMMVDELEYEKEQQKAKERSKKQNSSDSGDTVALDVHAIGEIEKKGIKPTDDSFKYGTENVSAKIVAIYAGKFVDSVKADGDIGRFGIILDRTNFYAEQGGQVNDIGSLTVDGELDFYVDDVQIFGGYVLHIGHLKYGQLAVGDTLTCSYDELRRWPLRNNHTATHIINYALRKTLGDAVDQKGSLVSPDKFRFDYSCRSAPTIDQLATIEQICAEFIEKNHTMYFKDVPLAQAKAINGLRAVFGEVIFY
jgi:alanyl-tRNA synthetase